MFRSLQKQPAIPTDPLAEAQNDIERLTAALSKAETELATTRRDYDHALREFIAGSRSDGEPSQEPQRAASIKVESLRRLLVQAREELARSSNQQEDARRIDAIRAAGGQLANLVVVAAGKVDEFQEAVTEVRRLEGELLKMLFDQRDGLRQPFKAAEIQRDADFARHRLGHQLIAIAAQGHCRIDARFEVDGGVHLGPLEEAFYLGR